MELMNRARLLLIERDSSLRLMIERQLHRVERLNVEVAEEASVGVERALLGQSDIIITSLHMEDMPASHLLESLDSARPKPVVIAMAHPQRLEELDETTRKIPWASLTRPVTRAALDDVVLRALRHHQEQLCCSILPTQKGHRSQSSEMLSRRRKGSARPVRLGHYEVFEDIGQGPKGAVYRGIDRRNGDEVALRAIPRELVERLGKKSQWFERFTREASTAAAINHPHLSAILDHGFEEDQRCLFVVSELAPGPPLSQMLESGPLDVRVAVKLAYHVSTALTAIHNGGLAHRLLRPSNIHYDDREGAIVTDIGVANMLAWDLMPLRPRLDRGPYLSPEQIRLNRVDDRCDQYALGLILHECLTGRHFIEGDTPEQRMHLMLSQSGEVRLDAGLEEREQLEEILGKLLALSPEERFQGDGELQTSLKDCAHDLELEV